MKLVIAITIFTMLFSRSVQAQSHQGFWVGTGGGVELGWWIHHLGSTEPGVYNTLGYARAHHQVSYTSDITFGYKFDRLNIGLAVGTSHFWQNHLKGNLDSRSQVQRIYIARGDYLHTLRVGGLVEYDLVKKSRFSLSPHLRFGTFWMDTIHPDRSNFGWQSYWDFGFANVIDFNRFSLVIKPKYTSALILTKTEIPYNEKHNIDGVGLNIVVRVWL